MRLTDLLTEELIVADLRATTRDGVIEELIDALERGGCVEPGRRADVARAVHAREASHTTGLGSSVAVPHGVSEGVARVVAALGIHRTGVDFLAVDGAPVHLVILLVVPPNLFQAHIRTLAGVARVLNDPSIRRDLLAATDAEGVLGVLERREG